MLIQQTEKNYVKEKLWTGEIHLFFIYTSSQPHPNNPSMNDELIQAPWLGY